MAENDLESFPGVGLVTTDKLVESGYDSYQSIAVVSPSELSNKADISSSTTSDIINAARDAADVDGFETGSTVPERCQQIGKLSQQISEVDEPLSGGLEAQSITEVYGKFGTGRSQTAHQPAVSVQLSSEQGGPSGDCAFIDPEDTFRPERIGDAIHGLEDEALEATLDDREMEGSIDNEETIEALVDDLPDKTRIVKVSNSNHQILLAERAKELAGKREDTEWPVRLFCVNSPAVHFCAEYVGRSELAERRQKLNKHLRGLMRIGGLFSTSILVMGQVSLNPDSYFGDPTQPIGDNILGHTSTSRIYLRKSKGDRRIVRLVDAPNLVDGKTVVHVRDAGLKPK